MTGIEWARDAYTRYSARDFSFVDAFTDDVHWHVPDPANPELHGRDQVLAFFNGLAQGFSAHTLELVDAAQTGDTLACRVVHTFTRHDGGGGKVDATHWWRFRDGRVAAMYEIADTMAVAHAFGMLEAPGA